MQTHAVKDAGQAQAARKRTGAGRSARTILHDGLMVGGPTLGANLADIPILPGDAAGASSALHRHAAGPGPSSVPASVREVLRRPGQSLPAGLRGEMETRLGCDFSDVRLHTDEDAGKSATSVAADAYTVGRHIVFGAGRFDPRSQAGRRLLVHELAHAASLPRGAALPTGELRISAPAETAERHAVAVAEGTLAPPAMTTLAPPALYRQPAPPVVALTGVTVNHDRVTVPPPAGHGLKATIAPPGAPSVTLALVGGTATIAAGTTINNANGKVTIDAKQDGGSADVEATQTTAAATITATAPFSFTAIPGKIISTVAVPSGQAGFYGADVVHTFDPPKAGAAGLEFSHVNEKIAGGAGTTLVLNGNLGKFTITINDPNDPHAGWDLDATGTMAGPDHVTWSDTTDARPFVVNASNKAPANTLPQALTAAQSMRNLNFPAKTYGATVGTTTHRRAFEDRAGKVKAVTSANAPTLNNEVVEDYLGPTVFRNAVATPASIPATTPAPPGGSPPAATTSTITVGAEGQATAPTFSINAPDLGCTIDAATGVLTPGATKGAVTARAGDGTNFDETKVTLT